MVQIKRISLNEKFMICLINKQFYISHTKQIKRNCHNCIEMKYNLDAIKCYVMLCYVRTSSLADIQALDLL